MWFPSVVNVGDKILVFEFQYRKRAHSSWFLLQRHPPEGGYLSRKRRRRKVYSKRGGG